MYARLSNTDRVRDSLKFQELAHSLGYDDLAEKDHQYMLKTVNLSAATLIRFAWIGINPPVDPSNSMLDLYNYAKDNLPYKKYTMTVEQNTGGGVRPHLHILAEVGANARKNHIITRLSKIFNIPENFVSVQLSINSSLVDKWRKYLQGEKKECKLDNVGQDTRDRNELGIPHIYKKPEEGITLQVCEA